MSFFNYDPDTDAQIQAKHEYDRLPSCMDCSRKIQYGSLCSSCQNERERKEISLREEDERRWQEQQRQRGRQQPIDRSKKPSGNVHQKAKQKPRKPRKPADEIFYAYEKENKASNDSSGIIWISIVTILIFIAIAATL